MTHSTLDSGLRTHDTPMRWFDAHLDLACLAENGRDLSQDLEHCGGPWQPAAITFPAMRGHIGAFLGTIFIEADGKDAVGYPAHDGLAAHTLALRQLACYQRWHEQGLLHLIGQTPLNPKAPACMLLMECADSIRWPQEMNWWAAKGVVAVGMAWARGSRYAGGNGEAANAVGLTDLGLQLVREMDRLGVIHDASHLSDLALSDLFHATDRVVIATHSNARARLELPQRPASQRHLTDAAIREITARGGVIGLNLYASFLRAGLGETQRPTVEDAIAHVEHICQVAGHRRCVGLGSDLDGGFSAAKLPQGISRPADFVRLAEALAARGWSDAEIEGFAWSNWAGFWKRHVSHTADLLA